MPLGACQGTRGHLWAGWDLRIRLYRFVPTFEVKKLMTGAIFVNKMHKSASMTITSVRGVAGFLNDRTRLDLSQTEDFYDMSPALPDDVS